MWPRPTRSSPSRRRLPKAAHPFRASRMPTLSTVILGTGSYAPSRIMTNAELSTLVDTSDEWIVTRSGIRERRIAAENEAASDMGVQAARRALEDAGITAAEIDLVVVATLTPDS